MKTPIEPIVVEEDRDLQDFQLRNAWVRTNRPQEGMAPSVRIDGREVCVLSPEQELSAKLAEMAARAKDVICVSSFLIQKSAFTDELLKAAGRGVHCYLLTAQKKDLMAASDDLTDHDKGLVEEHKKLLDELAGKVNVRTSEHFHAKFALFDPKGSNPWGIMSTSNLVLDAMRGKNLELSVTLTSREVRSFYRQFVRGFWLEAKHELRLGGVLKAVGRPPFQTDPGQGHLGHPATCGGCTTLREEILKIIDQAEKSITIGAWSFGPGYDVVNALEGKARKGLKVRVLCRTSDLNTKALFNLLESGATVYGEDRMHAKFLVADGEKGLIMTSNFGPLGLDSGFEVAVALGQAESGKVEDMVLGLAPSLGWELRWKAALRDCPDGEVQIYDQASGTLRKAEVSPEKFKKILNPIRAGDLRTMRSMPLNDRSFKSPNSPQAKKLYRAAELKQRIEVPVPPNDALSSEEYVVGFPVFIVDKGKERAVAVSTWEDLDEVLKAGVDDSIQLLYATPSKLESIARGKERQNNEPPSKKNK